VDPKVTIGSARSLGQNVCAVDSWAVRAAPYGNSRGVRFAIAVCVDPLADGLSPREGRGLLVVAIHAGRGAVAIEVFAFALGPRALFTIVVEAVTDLLQVRIAQRVVVVAVVAGWDAVEIAILGSRAGRQNVEEADEGKEGTAVAGGRTKRKLTCQRRGSKGFTTNSAPNRGC